MSPFVAEIIGTMLLILLGNGVVANALLSKTKGGDAGIVGIAIAWGLAVYVGVLVAGPYSGAHLNPAVSVGLAVTGQFEWGLVPIYIAGQCIGAALGSILVVLSYYDHYKQTDNLDFKLASFATTPAIPNVIPNILTEAIGTFVLLFSVLYIAGPELTLEGMEDTTIGLGSLGALPVALIVVVIGFSLGGPTGYAINPARDLIPRIMHGILPIGERRDSAWSYAWIPVVAPLIGAVCAAGLYLALQ
ncbi:MIP/aquaporin family protein [Portibacter lacus]|uniref:Glycerol uptake facilitator protein n=1 Tax=Portibacter lacus TaxID=1099794 RepID=A0AA37SVQ1_9BACT|nr:MIP/aquaporin family protein [Portibacter lacus]GLR20140.1 glycerol uptake facilitator protein [Portibacter lacus]